MESRQMKIRHLKVDKNTDWLSYQRKLPKELVNKAKQLGIKGTLVRPLGLTLGASTAKITAAIEDCNEWRDRIIRFLRATSAGSLNKAAAYRGAQAWLEARGIPQGSLIGIDPSDPEFDATLENALGIHQNQHHPDWERNYPDAERMPEALLAAVQQLLVTPLGHEPYHLFSDAVERYKQYRTEQIRLNSQTDVQRKRSERAYLKDVKRLSDFMEFAGNQEFTSDSCNISLRGYRELLKKKYPDTPSTAKRHLEVPSAALRRFADEVATHVSIAALTIRGQRANSKIRSVLDIETELPLVWAAAHDDSYDHFFRLHVFATFSGSHASELVQTDVRNVLDNAHKGYFVTGGTKRDHRSRPVIIVNEAHKDLLLKFSGDCKSGFRSICGHRANQTESNHSRLLKKELQRATGNPKLTAYCLRHTGKHLGEIKGLSNLPAFERIFGWVEGRPRIKDDYARAGIFAAPMIAAYRDITDKLIEDLPDCNEPTPAATRAKVVELHKR